MKSSTGHYFIGLDHVRAVAAFTVFSWHFIHVHNGQFAPPPVYPLSLFGEGHTGVALFMTLSGYLFAKLLDGKEIKFHSFLWNRFLRLVPLLTLIIFIVGIGKYLSGGDFFQYLSSMAKGVYRPALPNGGWSITVEFHFYLLLPLLLYLSKRSKFTLTLALLSTLLFRLLLYQKIGQIQYLSYWTIVGRLDQFLLGIMCYEYRHLISRKHLFVIFILCVFLSFYWYFDSLGGFYKNPSYPSPSPIWIFLPTIEGITYAILISWYDNSFNHSTGHISRFIAMIGAYSYSIYLFHFFIVFRMSNLLDKYLIDLSNLTVAILVSPIAFMVMIPIGYLSFKFIESPFLRLRTSYIRRQD